MYLYTLRRICNNLTVTLKGTAFHLALETNCVVITSTAWNVSSTGYCWWWGIPGWQVGENILGTLSSWPPGCHDGCGLKEFFVLCPGLASTWGLLVTAGRRSEPWDSSSGQHLRRWLGREVRSMGSGRGHCGCGSQLHPSLATWAWTSYLFYV